MGARDLAAENHRSCDGRHLRIVEVRPHSGDVAYVVPDVVGDHGRVARIVLRDADLDSSDEVGSYVGTLDEDSAGENPATASLEITIFNARAELVVAVRAVRTLPCVAMFMPKNVPRPKRGSREGRPVRPFGMLGQEGSPT